MFLSFLSSSLSPLLHPPDAPLFLFFPLFPDGFSGPCRPPVVSDSKMIPLISFQTAIFLKARLFGLSRPASLSFFSFMGLLCLSFCYICLFLAFAFPPCFCFSFVLFFFVRLRSGGFVQRRRALTSLPCLRLTARKRCNAGSIFIVIVSRAFVRIIQLFAQV